jgi:hypothetical protein
MILIEPCVPGIISALNYAMAEFKTIKKEQTRQLPLYAEPKDWLRI